MVRVRCAWAAVLALRCGTAGAEVDVVPFATGALAGSFRRSTQTIETLSPLGEPGFSFACSSTFPLDRSAGGHHHLGDVTLRLRFADGPANETELPGYSLHCLVGSECVLATPAAGGAEACRAACLAMPRAQGWSWGRAGSKCYCLDGRTAPPEPDGGAVCGLRRPQSGFLQFSTAAADGRTAAAASVTAPGELLAADLTPLLPGLPLRLERHFAAEGASGDLLMRLDVVNNNSRPIELGALGVSMVFDQVFTGRSLVEVAASASFNDPYIGGDAGYVQVVRATGTGPVLLVMPDGPGSPGFEAWRMLEEDPTARGVRFEGWYELLAHSLAWAENEWSRAQPWNPPTSRVLAPGERYSAGYRFALAPGLRGVDAALRGRGRPVAAATPGFVLTPALASAELHLSSDAPVASAEVQPPGALALEARPGPRGAEAAFALRVGAGAAGRVRVTLRYAGNATQHLHFFVHPDAKEHVESYARFLSRHSWYDDRSDAFHRAPAFMNWDVRLGKNGSWILQDRLAWVAGLSDECGASPSVGMAMKSLFDPERREVEQLEAYVDGPLWGSEEERAAGRTLQDAGHGVRASMFYSGKPGFAYEVAPCWDEARSLTRWRSYNYPHVTAVYWALYRLARNYEGLAAAHPWQWYLRQAAATTLAVAPHDASGLNRFGLMVGSVWLHLLEDLRAEAAAGGAGAGEWARAAAAVEAAMRARADAWSELPFPFGSEMPWDSTGQEEVYTWLAHFGFAQQARATLDAVLAYMPRVPSWGYHGNARRYFDFLVYGGEVPSSGTERGLHHYGSPLNAVVVLAAFRAEPDDLHLLEVGLGGLAGSLTNIAAGSGTPSMAWHGSPQRLHPDPTDCDYGVGFFGHAVNAGAYLVRDAARGAWRCFWCNLLGRPSDAAVAAEPVDAFRRRLYLAPLGLDVAAEAGAFRSFELDLGARTLALHLDTSAARVLPPRARVRLTAAALPGRRNATGFGAAAPLVRGAYEVDLRAGAPASLTVTWSDPGAPATVLHA